MIRRAGFTLVELLVVIAIIGILVALLLPAVQAAREASRRTQCGNHLKQFGLATHGFHDVHNHIPPARLWDHWATWAVMILPYMEQTTLYEQWDLEQQYYVQPQLMRESMVPNHFCPSRRPPYGSNALANDTPDNGTMFSGLGMVSDYAGCAGSLSRYTALGFSPDWMDCPDAYGAIVSARRTAGAGARLTQYKASVDLAKILDGTSSTLLIGEKHVPDTRFGVSVGDGSIWCGDHEWNYCRIAGPGFPLALGPKDNTANWRLQFGSWHPNVCQFVLCDGSVRPLRNDTDTTLLEQLINRADGAAVAVP